ncbi:DUF3298 and DUF4163 domain-containing protein [Bacillus paralicheniformis]|uniref:DUF3298 and DUF4163 domain-containing protein n=1 Tax=Bacillus paralicheniformis TaxID=1648923 RepID=UPI00128BE1AB|nr:DUF3298 and DUF4163 domain-containing protein [Bacillus paralicheniformis]MPQ25481.1 DUF3298 domain-containing protein [Bacillus paralicheniformis]
MFKNDFLKHIQNQDKGEKHHYKTDYQTSFKVKFNEANKLSVLIDDDMYSGGAHGMGTVKAYNYDLKTNKQIKLNQILNTKTKVKNAKNYIYNYIIKHKEIFFSDIEISNISLDKNTAFYFTKNGIAVVFQEYEVAPYAAGNPVVNIPQSIYK